MNSSTLIRLIYRSVPRVGNDGMDDILKTSQRNNARMRITGVLFQQGGYFYQILEGDVQTVDALYATIAADPRHDRLELLSREPVKSRQFELWGMGTLNIGDKSLGYATELLNSKVPEKVDIAVAYLWRWLIESSDLDLNAPSLVADSADSGRSALSRSLEGVDKAQSQSNLYFGFAILVGVLLDAGLYLRDMLTGNPDAWRMLWVHGLCAGGLLLSTLLALRNQRRASVNVFQLTAILSIAGHALFAGYGLAAPTLGYLAMFVLSEGFNQSGFQKIRQLTLLSVATVALVALLQLFTPPDLQPAFQREAPLHHQLIAALLLPCVALLVGQATLMTSERIATLGKDMVLEQSTLVAQLRKAMAARNHFFSAVSHEIRTPLTGITTAVALLKHPKTQPEAKARYLDAIEKSTTSLGLLINDVLDISRLESGSFTLAVVRFDLHALLNEVVEFFAPVARTHGNELGWQAVGAAAGASPLEIMADPQRIKQVLSNLIANANKFTTSGRISVELEGLPGPETFRMWKISVLDTGAGIEPGALDSLFSPFVQADNQQHAKGVGTGLGLAIVAALARQMNGDVGVSSTPGEGSRFWFTFRSA